MSGWVKAVLQVRRSIRASTGFVVALVVGTAVLLGVFRPPWSLLQVALASLWLGTVVVRGSRLRKSGTLVPNLEVALLLVAGVHAGLGWDHGPTGPFGPCAFVTVAIIAAFTPQPVGFVSAVASSLLAVGTTFVDRPTDSVFPVGMHVALTLTFGVLGAVFVRAEIARVRHSNRHALAEEKDRMREQVRMFRLVSAPTEHNDRDDERLVRSSLEEVHNSLYHLLDLLKRSLDLHTCIVLFFDEAHEHLRLVEVVTDSDDIADGRLSTGEGAVGAVVKRSQITNLARIRLGYRGLSYYRGPAIVRSFLGIPILDRGQIRGALCADRIDDRSFNDREEEILKNASRQILRMMENERVFLQLEQSKHEQTLLYRASQALGAALTETAVIEAGLTAAAEIVPYDFAALTAYDARQRRHTVRHAVGERSESLASLTFKDNASLTAMAVRNRHYLPYRGELDPKQQVVFTVRNDVRGMASALVLPLVVREDAIGTLTLAARRPGAFAASTRRTLQVLANQVAVALSNAQAVRRLEEMATTDGLTGCLNKRAFLAELEQRLKAAERFKRQVSLIVVDIDHFKVVNDTYGHATGDEVLKGLGEILRGVKRETDAVARFGGEEFCVLCEETDTSGASLLAERIREQLGGRAFHTELGELRVTCSLGVATFPTDGTTGPELFGAADRALYAAKHAGRNQVATAA